MKKIWKILNIKSIIKDIVEGLIICWLLSVAFCTAVINNWLPTWDGQFPQIIKHNEFIVVYVFFLVAWMLAIMLHVFLGHYMVPKESENEQITEEKSVD